LLINDFEVVLVFLGKENDLKGEALDNYRIVTNFLKDYPKSKLIHFKSLKDISKLRNCGVIVDAILGTGSKGELNEPFSAIIKSLNSYDAFKIAVDVPTGLDLETSTGEVVFQANLTITLSEYKTGLFYHKGFINSGEVRKGSIGIGNKYYDSLVTKDYMVEPSDALIGLPKKEINSHKYSAGKVLVIAGSGAYPGAACFTSNAVQYSGAGACFLAFPKSVKQVAQKKLDTAIVIPYNDNKTEHLRESNLIELEERIKWADVLVLGPGLGREEETLNSVRIIINQYKSKSMVIDADALYALGNNFYNKTILKNKILTPHHKEFADILGLELIELENNLAGYGKKYSVENKCWLVLKGAPTLIFTPKGEMLINSAGNPGMAKFGTGDALTGIIAGFIAQSNEIKNTLISAVYLHSLAADLLVNKKTEFSYSANDIIEELPNAIKYIRESVV